MMKRWTRYAFGLMLLVLAPIAYAQSYHDTGGSVVQPSVGEVQTSPGNVAPIPVNAIFPQNGATIGTSSSQVLAAGKINTYLLLSNPAAAGGGILYCTVNGQTPVVNAAGTLSIAPGQYVTFEANGAPQNANGQSNPLQCIASAASTPLTYGYR